MALTTLKVTFSNGKSICFHNSIDTMLSILRGIDNTRFPFIDLESSGRRLITQKVEKEDIKYAVEIGGGWWYIHKFQNTEYKFRHLHRINAILNLGLKIEIVSYEEKTDHKFVESKKRPKKNLIVRFIDSEIIEGASCTETIKRFAKKVGVEEIARKNLTWHGNPVIKTFSEDNREKVGDFRFILAPKNVKETFGLLSHIARMLSYKCEVLVA